MVDINQNKYSFLSQIYNFIKKNLKIFIIFILICFLIFVSFQIYIYYQNNKAKNDSILLRTNNEIELTWLDFFQNSEWPFNLLPIQKKFDISWVEKNPSKNWDWKYISISYNFDISWVDKYPDKKWNWEGI